MQNALRCGRISYTNDLPLYAAFDEGVLAFPGELIEDVPTALNQALLEGRLDCGPISSAFYAKHPAEFVLLPGVCIGSRRQVLSICCVSQQHPRELAGQRIAATKESETGRILFVRGAARPGRSHTSIAIRSSLHQLGVRTGRQYSCRVSILTT